MKEAAIVLFDMFSYYAPLYGISNKQFFLDIYPVLGFVQSLLAQTRVEVELDKLSHAE